MIVFKLRKHLLHYGLAEKHGLGPYPELVTILTYGSHLTVIQINDLSVPTDKRCFLLFKIFRIYPRNLFFLLGHLKSGLVC